MHFCVFFYWTWISSVFSFYDSLLSQFVSLVCHNGFILVAIHSMLAILSPLFLLFFHRVSIQSAARPDSHWNSHIRRSHAESENLISAGKKGKKKNEKKNHKSTLCVPSVGIYALFEWINISFYCAVSIIIIHLLSAIIAPKCFFDLRFILLFIFLSFLHLLLALFADAEPMTSR